MEVVSSYTNWLLVKVVAVTLPSLFSLLEILTVLVFLLVSNSRCFCFCLASLTPGGPQVRPARGAPGIRSDPAGIAAGKGLADAPQDRAESEAAGPQMPRHGFEIVDKRSGKEVYLDGSWAEMFQIQITAWQQSTPSQEEVEDTLEGYAELAQMPVVMH